jgi:hypothetical protein
MVIMMGNFGSYGGSAADNLQLCSRNFQKLADLLQGYPETCKKTHFVFIPGPNDPSGVLATILPRPPLPKVVTGPLTAVLSHVTFTTSPSRLKKKRRRRIPTLRVPFPFFSTPSPFRCKTDCVSLAKTSLCSEKNS